MRVRGRAARVSSSPPSSKTPPAAASSGGDSLSPTKRGKRKATTPSSGRKLLVGCRVEVRSLEDGLLGSWHIGTVIACWSHFREVRYDFYVCEDGSAQLEENVSVPAVIDGHGCSKQSSSYRGHIRPSPPRVSVDPGELIYGLCVDVYLDDAWWEGVILDHNVGAEERRVFFPDLGDDVMADGCKIQLTQDWVERDDSWVRRGCWPFLEVLKEYEKQFCLPVSDRQLWYDLQEKRGFNRIKEWTCRDKSLWEKLVLSTIADNLAIILYDMDRMKTIEEGTKSLDDSSSPVLTASQNGCAALPKVNESTQLGSKQKVVESPPNCSVENAKPDEKVSDFPGRFFKCQYQRGRLCKKVAEIGES